METNPQSSLPLTHENGRQSQNAAVLQALQSGQKLTPQDILSLCGSMRSSGRIWDLRHGKYDGTEYPIKRPDA